MKQIKAFALAAICCLVAFSCERESPVPPETENETGNYSFAASVWNEDYTEELVLEKMGEVSILSVESLPSWISGITLSKDLAEGNSIAQIEVKRTDGLDSKQTADIKLKMTNGTTAQLSLVQWPGRSVENDILESLNHETLEKDWASTKMIYLVTKEEQNNGINNTKTEYIRLPWADNSIHHLPYGEVSKMLEHKNDWRLVFNFTGVQSLPGCHYFGLYNRYTGFLRIFYYIFKEDTPQNGNDHLWSFELSHLLAEHISVQFSLPYDEVASAAYKTYTSAPTLMTPYANRSDDLDGGKYIPNQGWWAFDVNMSAARKHDFFSETQVGDFAAKITMKVYQEDNVMLNSILKGNLDGTLEGKINLDDLAPKSTSSAGTALGVVGSLGGGVLGSMYNLQQWFGKPQENAGHQYWGSSMAVLGTVLSVCGKLAESKMKEKPDVSDLGKLDANINLDLNATMTTQGVMGGARTTTIPPMSLVMDDFKSKTADGEPNGFGKGVWNLRKHPVIYVVNDAYWSEFHFTTRSTGVQGKYEGNDIYYYQLGTDPDRAGMRIISFLDPTSVEGIYLNDDVFDASVTSCDVQLVYGIYPGSEPGYTKPFRSAAGLETKSTWRLSKTASFNTQKDPAKAGFEVFTFKKDDAIFKSSGEVDPELTDYIAYRRSEQVVCDSLVRRFYGSSVFYTKETATPYEVDKVHYVVDPQIDLPLDVNDKRIMDPQLPDFVVTAVLRVQGMDHTDAEDQVMVHTLRFAPQIKFISYKDLPTVYNQMVSRSKNMHNITGKSFPVNWVFMDEQLKKVERFKDSAKK